MKRIIKRLKNLFDEIFTDSEAKEKRLIEQELPDGQIEIILDILKKYKITSALECEITNDSEQYKGIFKKKGYLYNIEDDSVIYTISMDDQKTKYKIFNRCKRC